jgi:hypothetical protein
MNPELDLNELTREKLDKKVSVEDHRGGDEGYLLGRLVEIRHRVAADGRTRETRVKVEILEREPRVVVTLTLGPDMRLRMA